MSPLEKTSLFHHHLRLNFCHFVWSLEKRKKEEITVYRRRVLEISYPPLGNDDDVLFLGGEGRAWLRGDKSNTLEVCQIHGITADSETREEEDLNAYPGQSGFRSRVGDIYCFEMLKWIFSIIYGFLIEHCGWKRYIIATFSIHSENFEFDCYKSFRNIDSFLCFLGDENLWNFFSFVAKEEYGIRYLRDAREDVEARVKIIFSGR